MFVGWHVSSALTGGKVATQKKFSSAYQLANIQILYNGWGSSISIIDIWKWTMDFKFLGGQNLTQREMTNIT